MTLKRKALIISIDGLQPRFLLGDCGSTPFLRNLASQGWLSRLVSVYPPLTYPAHVSMLTGVVPARHGVMSNTTFSWENGPGKQWYWDYGWIRAKTLWASAREQHKTVAALGWPVSFGAQIEWLVPEVFSVEGKYKSSEEDFGLRDQVTTEVLGSLLSRHQPDLVFAHILQADHAAHEHGAESVAVSTAMSRVDDLLRIILHPAVLERYRVFILGDHGFCDFDQVVGVNMIFAEKGWLTFNDGRVNEWTVIAHADGGQAAVYCKDGALAPEVIRVLCERSRGLFRVVDADELKRRGAFPEAVCALEPYPGVALRGHPQPELLIKQERKHGQHAGDPRSPALQTALLIVGKGICPFVNDQPISLLDLAPTVARWLSLRLGNVDGSVLDLHECFQKGAEAP